MIQWAPVAAFVGTVLTAIPVIRAAVYLRQRTKEPKPTDKGEGPLFSSLRSGVNRRLEIWAQHWPGWLMWSLMIGLTLVIYAAAISAAQSLGWLPQ